MSLEVSSQSGLVLFVEDDEDIRAAAELLLRRNGWRMAHAQNPRETWAVLTTQPVEVILLDLNFHRGATSGEEGLKHLAALVEHDPTAAIVVVTGHSGIKIAVAAMRAGAADFVMKPWNNDRLMATLTEALALRRRRKAGPAAGVEAPADDLILGEIAEIARVRDLIRRTAPTNAALLILGGPGVGKELAARTAHRQSGRETPFAPLDCAGLRPEAAQAFAEGLPAGASGSFSPASISGSGSSTLSVTTTGTTPVGTSTLTITATSGTLTQTSSVSLSVSSAGAAAAIGIITIAAAAVPAWRAARIDPAIALREE